MATWTYRQAWTCLIGSCAATLCLGLGGKVLWTRSQQAKCSDPNYRIAAIVQTGPEKEALKTPFFAELLDLSIDRPISLYAFDLAHAQKTLDSCPLLSMAKIRRVPPGTLYIDYTVRKPAALLADYHNIALDREGHLFPMQPFFSPKLLPEIYLGLPSFGSEADEQGRKGGSFHEPLQNKHLSLALDILQQLEDAPWKEGMRIQRIDVSNAFQESLGQREVVLLTEEELRLQANGKEVVCAFPKILRLNPKHIAEQLGHFLTLRRSMLADYRRQMAKMTFSTPSVRFAPRIVDLRISQMAFVQNRNP